MLGTFVVLYLFLGGCGAAALFVTAVWSLLFHRTETRTFQQSRAFWDLAGKLYLASFGLLALSAFCLLLDLGSPHRFFLLFLRPTASLLSAGSFVLLAALLASGCLAAVHALGWPAPSWARKGLEALCAVLATVLMVYTGLYLAWMEAVPLWSNGALPGFVRALVALFGNGCSASRGAFCARLGTFVRLDRRLAPGASGGPGTRVSGACRLSRPGRDKPIRRSGPRAACFARWPSPLVLRGVRTGRHHRSLRR